VIALGALLSAAVDDDDCPITSNPAAGLRNLVVDPNTLKSKRLTKDKYFERDEVIDMLTTARDHFAEWYPGWALRLPNRASSVNFSGFSGAISIGGRASSTFNARGFGARRRRRRAAGIAR
jgi:hypothetical protein